MKVRICQNRINSVLSVVVSTEDWSRHELDAIVRFGEPEIRIGGVFRKHCRRCDCVPHVHPPRGDRDKIDNLLDTVAGIVRDDVDSGYGIQNTLLDMRDSVSEYEYDESDMSNDPECFFELPEASKRVRSEFPVLVQFDADEFDDPEVCAKSWSDEIVRRIAEAVERLRKTSADLVKEEVYEF